MRNLTGAGSAADISVRRAGISDLVTLQRFEQGIIAVERPFDPTIKMGDVRYYDVAALIESKDAFVALAEANGEPIGCGLVRKTPSRGFTDPPFHAYVGLMYVQPEYRGKGVSQLILGALLQWAKSNSLLEVRLEVYPENLAAVRAYENFGFTPYLLEMRLPPAKK